MNIEIKHHQARAQLQCYLEEDYNIQRALELVTISYDLTADDLVVIRNMDMAFILATVE